MLIQPYLSPPAAPTAVAHAQYDRRAAPESAQSAAGPAPGDLGPPPGPGAEVRLTSDTSGVVTHCDQTAQELAKRGMTVVRKVVSQNSQYGVVWRADVITLGDSRDPFRMTCWRIPGQADYALFLRPLQMFDPSETIPPLAP